MFNKFYVAGELEEWFGIAFSENLESKRERHQVVRVRLANERLLKEMLFFGFAQSHLRLGSAVLQFFCTIEQLYPCCFCAMQPSSHYHPSTIYPTSAIKKMKWLINYII